MALSETISPSPTVSFNLAPRITLPNFPSETSTLENYHAPPNNPPLNLPPFTGGPPHFHQCSPGDDGGDPFRVHHPPCYTYWWIPHSDVIEPLGEVKWVCECKGEMPALPTSLVAREEQGVPQVHSPDPKLDYVTAIIFVVVFVLVCVAILGFDRMLRKFKRRARASEGSGYC